MKPGDIVIDGGNSFYKDDIRRAARAEDKGHPLCRCGTSGGVWGTERGYCMMIGGEKESSIVSIRSSRPWRRAPGASRHARAASETTIAPRAAMFTAGRIGAGHFVKMIHNGIEYGMMQAYRRRLRHPAPRRRRRVSRRAALRSQSARHRGGVAARQRDPVLAARSDGRGAQPESRSLRTIPALWRIPAKAAGRSWPPSKKRCPPMCSRPRCMRASVRASKRQLRQQDAVRDAPRLRRPYRAESETVI